MGGFEMKQVIVSYEDKHGSFYCPWCAGDCARKPVIRHRADEFSGGETVCDNCAATATETLRAIKEQG